jgi:hypothetical protein
MKLQAKGHFGPTNKLGGEWYFPGDPIPVAHAVEDNSEAAWEQWSHAEMELDAVLANVIPATSPESNFDERHQATPGWFWMRKG